MDFLEILFAWARGGVSQMSYGSMVIYALIATQITIAGVTLYLHRSMAHRSLDLHPIVQHFFRFWLWLTTGMLTKDWVAIHRKHHAKCETAQDPHSPQVYGLKTVFWQGSELYRKEAKNSETLERYGHACPEDWIERHLYTPFTFLGVSLLLVFSLVFFGLPGLIIWSIQMSWIPFWAAGVVNGVGHYWGYRNFETIAPDTSHNLTPWGLIIGGEELHNNHHTYPTSAKFSIKPFEFDIGWFYIRVMQFFGLAKPRKVAPQLRIAPITAGANLDGKTLEAILANRYEIMSRYSKGLALACKTELARLKTQGGANLSELALLKKVRSKLLRDEVRLGEGDRGDIDAVCQKLPKLATWVSMRRELSDLWSRSSASAEQLQAQLRDWCRRAEESGIAALQDFAQALRHVAPARLEGQRR